MEVRRVERLDIGGVLYERLYEDRKEDPTQLEAVRGGLWFLAEDDVKDILEDTQKFVPFSSFVGVMSKMVLTSRSSGRTSRQVASGRRREHFNGEPRDGGHWFEETPDNVLALGEQRVAEPLQDEWGEEGAVHLGEGDVAVSSSVIGLLCSSCVPVLSRG